MVSNGLMSTLREISVYIVKDPLFNLVWSNIFLMIQLKTDGMPITLLSNMRLSTTFKMFN